MPDALQFVEFLESHRSPLTAGKYEITVTQTFSEEPSKPVGGGTWSFTVAGPQFSLSPQEIAAVFPPAGSLGDHTNVLPHVALHRSTLPWERSGDKTPRDNPANWTEAAMPWLALLVYGEDDLDKKEIRLPAPDNSALTVAKLEVSDASYHLPDDAAPGDTAVSAVDVKTASLRTFIPSALECRLLCHVRRNILFRIPWNDGREPTVADLQGRFPSDIGLSAQATVTRAGESRCWRLIDDKRARSFLLWENASKKKKTLQVTDEDAAEYAFVIGNRLPRIRHERLRFDRLAPDILLCLFEGSPTRFEVHLPRETIHFGVKVDDEDSSEPKRETELLTVPGVVLEDGRLRLKRRPRTLDPAVFALSMVEGVPKVVFERPVTA